MSVLRMHHVRTSRRQSQENVFEVSASIATSEFAKSQLKEWMKPVEAPLPKFLAASGHKGMVYREPYGVTLIICPFNGPLLLSLRPAVAALSAGNPCILKLSEALLATDELLLELIPKYFEPESMSAVVGGTDVVTNLLTLPFDFIFLTGSVGVGKVVMRAAAENLTPVLLELGGQNPAIVDETANIPDAAKKIVWGAMAWGGQWCTSPGYAVVHESVAEQFVAECKKAVVELYGTDPKNNPDYSRVISPAAVETACVPDRSQEGRLRRKVRRSGPLSRPDHPLPDFLVRQNHGRRNLWAAFAYPHLLRAWKATRKDQVAPQTACRLRVQPKSAGDRSCVAVPFVRRRRGKSDQCFLVH